MCQAINPDAAEQPAYLDIVTCSNTLKLRGDLDLATAPYLEQLLDQLRGAGQRKIALDLSGVEFLCAAGLSVFVRADQALRAVGGRLVLTRPSRIARRVLAITGLDATLSIQPIQRA